MTATKDRLPPVHRESCGTLTGRNLHISAGEVACTACKAIHAAYMKEYRDRNRPPPRNAAEIAARARKTAIARLLEESKERFEVLYAEAEAAEARLAANSYPHLEV